MTRTPVPAEFQNQTAPANGAIDRQKKFINDLLDQRDLRASSMAFVAGL